MSTNSPDTGLHVTLEYVEPGGNAVIRDVIRKEFDVGLDGAAVEIRRVAEAANMDPVHRESMFAHIARMRELYNGFMFLESESSRRVCLTVSSGNGNERSHGFHGPHEKDWCHF